MSPADLKSAARAAAAERRARAQALNPLAGQTLAALFPADRLLRPDLVVAGYWPVRSEIDPRPLMTRLSRLGARIALPVTPPKGSDAPMIFRAYAPNAQLWPGHFRVPEPGPDEDILEPDLLLVPMMAFDRTGHRLGYGAGHYDRTLECLRGRGSPSAVGLAYAAQEIDRLPADRHDQRLDAIVTERAFIAVHR